MCALLGMSFAEKVFAGFSFQMFGKWGEDNADGWGLAWYPDQSASLVKEPVRWGASAHNSFLMGYRSIHSPIYLAHVRHRTSGGPPTHADTHPFVREWAGRHYCFAHNGTITEARERLPVTRFQPVGSTDSEQLFCHLLDEMANAGVKSLSDECSWRWLHEKLRACNRLGKLNCLLTDGARLFCYRDVNCWKNLVYCQVYLLDNDNHVFADPNLKLSLETESINQGVMVATQPLSGDGWQPLAPSQLLVLEKGRVSLSAN